MTTFPANRANADYPVTPARAYYGDHDYEHFHVFRPSGSFSNSSLLIFCHGGLGHDPGDASMQMASGGVADQIHQDMGWPVVSVELPPVASNDNINREMTNVRLWPGPIVSLAKAVMFLKAHYDDPVLWGAGNSIAPGKVWGYGASYGATLFYQLALMPSGYFAADGLRPLARSDFYGGFDHRLQGVVGSQGQIDWTQFAFDPSVSLGVYGQNIHQVFMFANQGLEWGTQYGGSPGTTVTPADGVILPDQAKKSASPWWWLVHTSDGSAATEGNIYQPNRNVYFYNLWPQLLPGSSKEDSLRAGHFSPGTPRVEEDLGLAWYDPHHNFQAVPWALKLEALGITQRCVAGNATTLDGYDDINATIAQRSLVTATRTTPEDVTWWMQNVINVS